MPDQPGIAFQWDNVYAEPPAAPEKPITKRPDQPGPPHGRRSPGPGSGPIATPHWSGRLQWDDAVMLQNLERRSDLNNRAARVLSDAPRWSDGRIPVEMFLGRKRLWVKPENLARIAPRTECWTEEPFNKMPEVDRTDLSLFFWANQGSVRIPGKPLRWMPRMSGDTSRHPHTPAPFRCEKK